MKALAALAVALSFAAPAASEPDLASPQNCAQRLAAQGVAVERAEMKPQDAACLVSDPVRLISTTDPRNRARVIRFPDRPLLSCGMAERFGRFVADIAAPLAVGIHGRELDSVSTGPGFECRPRNRVAGAKPSSHGRGEAVDIMAVELQERARMSVAAPPNPESVRYFAAVRAAACGAFSTVLGPGSDASHSDHLHVDIEARGRDGRSKFCQ